MGVLRDSVLAAVVVGSATFAGALWMAAQPPAVVYEVDLSAMTWERDPRTMAVPTVLADRLPASAPASGAAQPPPWLPPCCMRLWPTLLQAGAAHGVDPALLSMVSLVESGCGGAAATSLRAGAITSSAGAAGIFQIMPATAAGIARNRRQSLPQDWRTNEPLQADYAAWLLASEMRAYGRPLDEDPDYIETIRLACIAYNGGPRAVTAYRSGAPFAESLAHSGWVVGMWRERAQEDSPTFRRWVNAGGRQWLDCP